MTNVLTFIICKFLVLGNRFSRLISSSPLILHSIIFISYILLSVSSTIKGTLLVKVGSISDIISLSVKLGRRVVWFNSLLNNPL
jgi:hypothetical protein